jgi:hypothetical protein
MEVAFVPPPLKPLEHLPTWLEELFELSDNFDAPIY